RWQRRHESRSGCWVVSPVGLRPPLRDDPTAARYATNRQGIHLSDAKRCTTKPTISDMVCRSALTPPVTPIVRPLFSRMQWDLYLERVVNGPVPARRLTG